eukprot:RCo030574
MSALLEFAAVIVGVVLPLVSGVQVLSMKPSKLDCDALLAYWISFSLLLPVELFLGSFLRWVPFYSYFRVALLFWLYSPLTRGSQMVCDSLMQQVGDKLDILLETIDHVLRLLHLDMALGYEQEKLASEQCPSTES